MTSYEFGWLLGHSFLPVLLGKARREVKHLLRGTRARPAEILDVGGRKSPYTIGLPVKVTIVDLPRESEVQTQLHLGLNEQILARLRERRSNLEKVVLEDMTRSTLPDASFDGAVSVEVIEHVPDDENFVRHIARVLKRGGWLYLTTPNGDYVRNEPPNYNPDHVRHYTRQGLANLLKRHFDEVQVNYGIKTGKYRYHGLNSMALRQPLPLMRTMTCNVISRMESRGLEEQSQRTAHLFAIARKNSTG